MNQTFNALLELDKRSVVGNADHFTIDFHSDRIFFLGGVPWIGCDLLQPQADALGFPIKLQHDDLNLLPHLQQIGWMFDASPAHIRYVKKPIDSAKVYECAVIHNVFHQTRHYTALFDHIQRFFSFFQAIFFKHGAPADNDIAAALVEFQYLEPTFGADESVMISNRSQVQLRTRQESPDTNVHGHAALHLSYNCALDRGMRFV